MLPFALAVVPAVALAQQPPALAGRPLEPLNVDARLMLNTDILLLTLELGAGADVGVVKAGPGTLSVGGEIEVGTCVSVCLVLNALTNLRWGFRDYNLYGRVGYHHPVNSKNLDVYGFLFGGLVVASTGASSPDGSVDFTGTDTAIGLGVGGGANYFVADRLFIGAELRYRFASGVYEFTGRFGNYRVTDRERSWSLTGLGVRFHGGLRF